MNALDLDALEHAASDTFHLSHEEYYALIAECRELRERLAAKDAQTTTAAIQVRDSAERAEKAEAEVTRLRATVERVRAVRGKAVRFPHTQQPSWRVYDADEIDAALDEKP